MPPYRDHRHRRSMVVEAKWGYRADSRSWFVVHESERLIAKVSPLVDPPLDPLFAPRPARPKREEQILFEQYAGAVRELALFASSLDTVRFSAPYIQILAMGPAVLPYLSQALRDDQDLTWLPALAAITRMDPAEGSDTVDEAVAAWLTWAAERGLVDPVAA